MTWNIFKRVALLEKAVSNLTNEVVTQYQTLSMLHNQIRARNRSSEIDQEKERKREYHREWYAKRRVELKKARSTKEQKEKRAAYARAYYLRKKGEKNA
jgi:hypothetical protein